MKKIISIFMMSILILGTLAACGGAAEKDKDGAAGEGKDTEAKVLKMGTSADYAPFEYIDTAKGSDPTGIDIEIATDNR